MDSLDVAIATLYELAFAAMKLRYTTLAEAAFALLLEVFFEGIQAESPHLLLFFYTVDPSGLGLSRPEECPDIVSLVHSGNEALRFEARLLSREALVSVAIGAFKPPYPESLADGGETTSDQPDEAATGITAKEAFGPPAEMGSRAGERREQLHELHRAFCTAVEALVDALCERAGIDVTDASAVIGEAAAPSNSLGAAVADPREELRYRLLADARGNLCVEGPTNMLFAVLERALIGAISE